jgi:hypothetical protein
MADILAADILAAGCPLADFESWGGEVFYDAGMASGAGRLTARARPAAARAHVRQPPGRPAGRAAAPRGPAVLAGQGLP